MEFWKGAHKRFMTDFLTRISLRRHRGKGGGKRETREEVRLYRPQATRKIWDHADEATSENDLAQVRFELWSELSRRDFYSCVNFLNCFGSIVQPKTPLSHKWFHTNLEGQKAWI